MNNLSQENIVYVAFGELGIKSKKVRRRMTNQLISNISSILDNHGVQYKSIHSIHSRIVITSSDNLDKIRQLVCNFCFGVVWASLATMISTPKDYNWENYLDKISSLIVSKIKEDQSFRISVRRNVKSVENSQQIASKVGAEVLRHAQEQGKKINVKLRLFDHEFIVELRPTGIYLLFNKKNGFGGLPAGSQGQVLAFICNKKDLVASLLIARRGSLLFPVYYNLLDTSEYDQTFAKLVQPKFNPFIINPDQTNSDTIQSTLLSLAEKYDARAIVCSSISESLAFSLFPVNFPVFIADNEATMDIEERLRNVFKIANK